MIQQRSVLRTEGLQRPTQIGGSSLADDRTTKTHNLEPAEQNLRRPIVVEIDELP